MNVLLKRVIATVFIFCLLFSISTYIFIPSSLTIRNISQINCNTTAASRIINSEWKKVFNKHTDTTFVFGRYSYKIQTPVYNGSIITITKESKIYKTTLLFISVSSDTSLLQWNTQNEETSMNPIVKVVTYFEMKALKENMKNVINQLQAFLHITSNVYVYDISYTTLTDKALISIKTLYKTYPTVEKIYKSIDELQRYMALHDAKQTNFPMLNITHTDSGYLVMTGIPTNKLLPIYKNIFPKRLSPIKDKILTTDVKGGDATIQNAYKKIELFMNDHSLSAPVIPFEYIITDRSKEPDTSKWITKICFPII